MIKPNFLVREIQLAKQIINQLNLDKSPSNLYTPIQYLLSIGGKRIRPALVFASSNLFFPDNPCAKDYALAVEIFHNFTLMHDDIMDEASTRRGVETVHKKFSTNAAILSGDMMLIQAYGLLQHENSEISKAAISCFQKMAEEVCKGQQLDVDFETETETSIQDYLQMIEWKTSVLLAACMQLGGIINNTSQQNQYHLYEYGKNIGIAFQIQDDILDSFGNTAKVGKFIGGDIVQGKKTYLYLKSLELLDYQGAEKLQALYDNTELEKTAKIEQVLQMFNQASVKVYAEELMAEYKNLALSHLEAVKVENEFKKNELKEFSDFLIQRNH